jgi:SagB-type dehydrogenase family enzyme
MTVDSGRTNEWMEAGGMSETTSSVRLPEQRNSDTSIEAALQSRRSIREFALEPLTLADVSQLLWAAQGETGTTGLRTAPSAGALYPLRLYLVSGDVTGLDPAVYRYVPGRHELRRTRGQDRRAELSAAALHQECVRSAAATLVIAADGRDTIAKYGARARRYIDIEVGHAAQNVHLQARALGLGSVDVGAFDDAAVEDVLGLPRAEEPLLLLPVGRRRKG